MIAVVALALLESVQAFSAPAMKAAPTRSSAVTMFSEGDLGVLPPLGVYDPLGLIETRDMRRYEVRPRQHGPRFCLWLTQSGLRLPPRFPPSGCPHAPLELCCWFRGGCITALLKPVCPFAPGYSHARPAAVASSQIMEIKHGRAAMLGFLHVIAIHAGIRFPGYLSPSLGVKFSDVPAGCFASLEAVPTFGWLQIMFFTCMQETGASPFAEPQTDDKEPGDIAGIPWVRYDDPETKAFKLNVERQNGRAAMMGILGCFVHELLGVDALYPCLLYTSPSPRD